MADRTPPAHRESNGRHCTRSWIVTAFNRLVLRRPYPTIGVSELTRQAGVGRSTFYEHFEDKDAVLREAIVPVLTPLALAATLDANPTHVQASLDHFRQVQPRVVAILDGPIRIEVERALSQLIREQLQAGGITPAEQLSCGSRMLAASIAGAQLSLIRAWLATPSESLNSHEIATMLIETTQAMVSKSAGI